MLLVSFVLIERRSSRPLLPDAGTRRPYSSGAYLIMLCVATGLLGRRRRGRGRDVLVFRADNLRNADTATSAGHQPAAHALATGFTRGFLAAAAIALLGLLMLSPPSGSAARN